MSIAERIHRDLEAQIRSGAWPPGTRIPFEQEIAERYGCARATAHKALARLAQDGLVVRRRRAGSFVAAPPLHSAAVGVPDIGALIAARGEAYRWQLLARTEDTAPPREAEAEAGVHWLAIMGVHHAGALPLGHEARWVNAASVPAATAADFAAEAPGSWLLAHVPWSAARHRVRAVAAGAAVAQALGVDAGTPCLQIERWTWRDGAAVTYVRQCFPGDRYDLVERFGPQG